MTSQCLVHVTVVASVPFWRTGYFRDAIDVRKCLDFMEDPNGAQPDRVQVRQARRPPAHESVTLRHYKPLINMQETEAAASPTSRRSTYAQADAPNLVIKKHSSDESTNAEEWFERWNHDVRVQPARSNDSKSCGTHCPFVVVH